MWKWLLAFLAFLFPVNRAANVDYVGDIAAHAAYASLLPGVKPVAPKVPTKDCKTCNGTGRVRSGDGHEWTKCPDCDGELGAPGSDAEFKIPKSDPTRYKQPAAGLSR